MFSVNIPLPGMDGATEKQIEKVMKSMADASLDGPVRGGVQVTGDAAAYALNWEWGNARQEKQGPKTVKGVNPDGEEVWLSTQAPEGYIRIHEPEYTKMLLMALANMDFGAMVDGKGIRKQIAEASQNAAKQIAALIAESAPVDSGNLRDSISPCKADDPDLDAEDDEIELGGGF